LLLAVEISLQFRLFANKIRQLSQIVNIIKIAVSVKS